MKTQIDFDSLQTQSNKYRETRDCAVKAVATVLGTSYEDAHSLLEKFGREYRKGTDFNTTTTPALESRGFIVKKVPLPSYIKTINNLEESIFSRSLKNPVLVRTSGHIIGFRNGKANDYTTGRRFRILSVYEVIPTPEAVHSVDVDGILNNNGGVGRRAVKIKDFKYALIHKDTGEVYKKYLRKPAFKTYLRIANGNSWITGKEIETKGKLKLIEL